MIGPINIPEVEPVTRVPRAFPLCFLGVCDAIKAWAFEMKPENKPWRARKAINSQTLVTSPIKNIAKAIPKEARINMILRPLISASIPHNGETMAVTRKVAA